MSSELDIITALVSVRYDRGLTQEQVAHRMCTGRANLAHFERHRRSPTLATLLRYAEAVGAELLVRPRTEGL